MFKAIVIVWIAALVIGVGVMAGSDALTALVVALFGIALAAVGIQLYFLPSINARKRHHPNAGAIFVINLFLGWTLLGWVGALAWSCTRSQQPVVN